MKIGIIGAVQEEVQLLFAQLENEIKTTTSTNEVHITNIGNLEFHEGFLNNVRVVVVCCGVGKVNAALCAQILISVFNVSTIINTGSAGGLDSRLSVLDIIVSTDLVQHDVDATIFGYKKGQVPGFHSPFYNANEGMRKAALQAFAKLKELNWDELGFASTEQSSGLDSAILEKPSAQTTKPNIIEGRIASGDQFVSSDQMRNFLIEEFAPLCVEMEGAAIAHVCVINKIPFLILRSISDLAGEQAHMSYEDFAVKAAHISSRLVIEMLNIFASSGTDKTF